MISYQQALACISEVVKEHLAKHGEAPAFIVVVGGTALAAHGVRQLSEGVDYYSPLIDEDIVHAVETRMKSQFGRAFKIDATPGENLWGPIIFRDIANSAQIGAGETGGRPCKGQGGSCSSCPSYGTSRLDNEIQSGLAVAWRQKRNFVVHGLFRKFFGTAPRNASTCDH